MYLLYVDESGAVHDPSQELFVLAGFCTFERQAHWISAQLEKIAERFSPGEPASIELHGNPMLKGKKPWRYFPLEDRERAVTDALSTIKSDPYNRVFACVIRKAAVSPRDPVEVAFEQIASRFDRYLIRLHKSGNTQRGLIIFDKSTYETTIQALATDFKTIGYTWGIIRNFAEVPLFLDSKASRLIQLADLVAYAVFRKYTRNDNEYFSVIEPCFDQEGGVIHGLHVIQ